MTALNPVLYQLYMIPPFRKGILSLPEAEFHNTDKPNNLVYQLKKLFEEYDQDKLPDLKSLCYAFKDWEGNPTDPQATIDAIEFLHTFFDRLENALKPLGKDQILNEPFRGKILHEILFKDCSHEKSRPEDFYTVSLEVKNKKDLEDGLKQFVQGEMLEGDNQFFCEQCQKKVDAMKRDCLYELPDHICLSLKRFEFDFDTMQNVLVKDYFEVPNVVDLKPFTHASLSEKTEEEGKESNRYRLGGAIVYSGFSPSSGFYYSLVKDREDGEAWHKMGPKGKEKFDFKDLPEETFGGEGSKKSNGFAYMLFYDKIDSHEHHVYEKEP